MDTSNRKLNFDEQEDLFDIGDDANNNIDDDNNFLFDDIGQGSSPPQQQHQNNKNNDNSSIGSSARKNSSSYPGFVNNKNSGAKYSGNDVSEEAKRRPSMNEDENDEEIDEEEQVDEVEEEEDDQEMEDLSYDHSSQQQNDQSNHSSHSASYNQNSNSKKPKQSSPNTVGGGAQMKNQNLKSERGGHNNQSVQNSTGLIQEKSGTGRPGRPSKKALAAKAAAGSINDFGGNSNGMNGDKNRGVTGNGERSQFGYGGGMGNDGSDDDEQGSDIAGDGDYNDFIYENQDHMQKTDFKKFSDKERISSVFSAMDDLQRERFETFRQSNFDEKKMKKILSSILGTTGKMHKNISAIIKSVAKIYVGQLVEESKLIQIEEIQMEQLQQQQYQIWLQQQQSSQQNQDSSDTEATTIANDLLDKIQTQTNLINNNSNSNGGTQITSNTNSQQQIPQYSNGSYFQAPMQMGQLSQDLGPIQPQHLVEARRRLLSRGELISEKPKCMLKRR